MSRVSRQFIPFCSALAAEWDRTVHGSPDGWVFGLSGWQRLILAVERWALRDHSFALRENGELAAVMPLQFNPASRLMTSSGWGGTGPIISGTRSGKVRERTLGLMLEHARELAREAGATMLDFVTSPVTQSSLALRWGVNPFLSYGFRDVSQVSQVIDLSGSDEQLRAALSDKTKSTMRRALNDGIEIREVSWADYLDDYYDAHTETYQRTGVPPHPRAYFAGIAGEIAPQGHAVLLAAFDRGGKAIGFNNTARFGGGAFYHTGCSRRAALDNGTNHLLLWTSILAARKAGCRWFDVGPVDPGSEDPKVRGLTLFKTRFGGEPHRLIRSEMTLSAPATQTIAEADAQPTIAPAVAVVPQVVPHQAAASDGGSELAPAGLLRRLFRHASGQ